MNRNSEYIFNEKILGDKDHAKKAQVGVDNVCERAALAGCGANGTLIYEKQAFDGMTIAIAERNWSIPVIQK